MTIGDKALKGEVAAMATCFTRGVDDKLGLGGGEAS
jgi:hypothetical protein